MVGMTRIAAKETVVERVEKEKVAKVAPAVVDNSETAVIISPPTEVLATPTAGKEAGKGHREERATAVRKRTLLLLLLLLPPTLAATGTTKLHLQEAMPLLLLLLPTPRVEMLGRRQALHHSRQLMALGVRHVMLLPLRPPLRAALVGRLPLLLIAVEAGATMSV
jgi:hypothetical protein